jgi:hypothetical protein
MSDSTLVSFKNVKYGKDKAGRETTTLYLTQEQAAIVAEEIQKNLGNERGVKISVHATEEDAPWGGKKVNAFGFVNGIEAPGANRSAPGARPAAPGQGAKGKFVPKAPTVKGPSAETRARAAATLNTEVE